MTSLHEQLAESIKRLGHTVEGESDVNRSKRALRMAYETLAIAKTIFLEYKQLWMQVSDKGRKLVEGVYLFGPTDIEVRAI